MLLTELGESVYGESSDELESNDDDDVEYPKSKKKLFQTISFKYDIDNEKDYDTDLEGLITDCITNIKISLH